MKYTQSEAHNKGTVLLFKRCDLEIEALALKIGCCGLLVVMNTLQNKTLNRPCPVPCCDIEHIFIDLSKGTQQAFKNFISKFVHYTDGISQNEWAIILNKIHKITLNMYYPVLWFEVISFLCSSFDRINSNQFCFPHFTENLSEQHLFTIFFTSDTVLKLSIEFLLK